MATKRWLGAEISALWRWNEGGRRVGEGRKKIQVREEERDSKQ